MTRLLTLLLPLALCGCFDVSEDVWIHDDGRVSFRVEFALPVDSLLPTPAPKDLLGEAERAGVTLVDQGSRVEGGRRRTWFQLEVDPGPSGDLEVGGFSLRRLPGGAVRLTRTLKGMRKADPLDALLAQRMTQGFTHTVRVHAAQIRSCPNGSLSPDGTTATWRVPTGSGAVLTAELEPGGGDGGYLLWGLLVGGALAAWSMRRRLLGAVCVLLGSRLIVRKHGVVVGAAVCLAFLAFGLVFGFERA